MTKQTQSTGLDIDSIVESNPSEITHRVGIAFDDDGEPTAGFIIVGRDSDQYRGAIERQRIAGIRRQAVKNQRIDGKSKEGAAKINSLVQNTENEVALAVTVGWFGLTAGGVESPFDVGKLADIFKARPSYREKILAALEVEENFLPK